jgi:zinc protease
MFVFSFFGLPTTPKKCYNPIYYMQYFTEKLANGLTIFYGEIKDSPLVNLNIRINYGYRDEEPGQESFHHLLEHLMFAGSRLYPDEFAIGKVKEETGSYVNASTSLEYINATSEFLEPDTDRLFELISNLVIEPILTQERVDREKEIINQELSRLTNDPNRSTYHYSMKSLFNGTDLAKVAYGSDRAIGEVTVEQIQALHQKVLDPERMAVICVGNIGFEKVKELTQKHLGHLPKKPISYRRPEIKLNPKVFECDFVSQKSKVVQISFLTVSSTHPDDTALSLLSWILSHGIDSRLYQALRIKTKLAYSVSSGNPSFTDAGYFVIKFQSDQPDQAIQLVYKELDRLNDLTEEELSSSKKSAINTQKRENWSDRDSLADSFAWSFTTMEKIETPEEYERKINEVTLTDILRVAKSYLTEDKAIVVRTK